MSELVSSKLYTFEGSEGKEQKHRVSESKLIFADEKGKLIPGCVYKPEDFSHFLSGKKQFDKEFIFFKTSNIKNNFGETGNLEIVYTMPGEFKIKFNNKYDLVDFKNNNLELKIGFFFAYSQFENSGFGNLVMSLLKSNSNKIVLKSLPESESFYIKEGFKYNKELDVVDHDGFLYKGMEWSPKTEITPELRKAVNIKAKQLRKNLNS
jgi:hypothetical protein